LKSYTLGGFVFINLKLFIMKRFKEFLKEGGGFQVTAWVLLAYTIVKIIIAKC